MSDPDVQEAAGYEMCIEEALKNERTQEQAINCEDGELDCSECPFCKCVNCAQMGARPSSGLCVDCLLSLIDYD